MLRRNNTDFLPVAYVLGLQPGIPVEVPIVVVAEDSVTSLRYYLQITRGQPADNDTTDLAGTSHAAWSILMQTALVTGTAVWVALLTAYQDCQVGSGSRVEIDPRRCLVYLMYWTVDFRPLMVYPKVLYL